MKLSFASPGRWATEEKVMLGVLAAVGVILVMLIAMAGSSHPVRGKNTPSAPSVKTTSGVTTLSNQKAGNPQGAHTEAAAAPASNPVASSAACRLLTLTIAQQLLGSGAKADAANASAASKTTDTETSVCVYANPAATTIKLTAEVALTSLGASENAVAFGSGKPSGASEVQGYGQAAYWDPDTAELNILDNNNRLVLSRSSGSAPAPASLSDVEAAADAMRSEF